MPLSLASSLTTNFNIFVNKRTTRNITSIVMTTRLHSRMLQEHIMNDSRLVSHLARALGKAYHSHIANSIQALTRRMKQPIKEKPLQWCHDLENQITDQHIQIQFTCNNLTMTP